jgi:nucleotide-binding universal stress UspA family protein
MGTHGRTGLRRLVVGSVTEAVMRLADVPVIAVNPKTSEKGAVRRVLCEVRYTPECRDAVTIAAALADGVNAPLTLLRTVDSDTMQNTIDDLIQLRAWVPRELVDRCELKIVPAKAPGEQVVELAKLTHADLIAIGVPHDRSLADALRLDGRAHRPAERLPRPRGQLLRRGSRAAGHRAGGEDRADLVITCRPSVSRRTR